MEQFKVIEVKESIFADNNARADALRAEIIAKGYNVMISKDGVTVKKQ